MDSNYEKDFNLIAEALGRLKQVFDAKTEATRQDAQERSDRRRSAPSQESPAQEFVIDEISVEHDGADGKNRWTIKWNEVSGLVTRMHEERCFTLIDAINRYGRLIERRDSELRPNP